MTVGKIYAGLLIAENWRAFKANKSGNKVVGSFTLLNRKCCVFEKALVSHPDIHACIVVLSVSQILPF